LDHFSKTGSFLRDALKAFDRDDLVSFFAERSLETKAERDGRIFPVTDKASSVVSVLEKELREHGVTILRGKVTEKIIVSEGIARGVVLSGGVEIEADSIIIATGGLSYKTTGSTGDGIKWAREAGHKISPLRPGLVSLNITQDFPEVLEGLSLEEVRITFRCGKKKFETGKGSVLFTGAGITGPMVLAASDKVIDWFDQAEVSGEVDIIPDIGIKEADQFLARRFREDPNVQIKTMLKDLVPLRFADLLCSMANIAPDKQLNQITEKERKSLRGLLKCFRFDISKDVSIEKAQITRGGVSVREIDPKTMESKIVKGLCFAGEMIDIDGDCGGFNLQAAFSTGYLAGYSASELR